MPAIQGTRGMRHDLRNKRNEEEARARRETLKNLDEAETHLTRLLNSQPSDRGALLQRMGLLKFKHDKITHPILTNEMINSRKAERFIRDITIQPYLSIDELMSSSPEAACIRAFDSAMRTFKNPIKQRQFAVFLIEAALVKKLDEPITMNTPNYLQQCKNFFRGLSQPEQKEFKAVCDRLEAKREAKAPKLF